RRDGSVEEPRGRAALCKGPRRARANAPLPPYVEYGGLATCPSPVTCTDATLYGFFLQGDPARLLKLCESVFSRPSGGQVDVRPLTREVMLTGGVVEKIEPQPEPWAPMGYASERPAGVWIPVAVVRSGAALQIGWFVPYMWVDNPLSLAGGREIYGYSKNWGAIGLPAGGDPPVQLTLDAYGGDYDPSHPAGRYRLLEITSAKSRAGPARKVT